MDQTFYGRRKRNGLKSPWYICHSHMRMLKLKEVKVCDKLKAFKASLGAQYITLDDLLKAEKGIVEFCQKQRYTEEMSRIEKASVLGKCLSRFSSLYKLDPVMDDGVLRVGGRLNKSAMPEETKRSSYLNAFSSAHTFWQKPCPLATEK